MPIPPIQKQLVEKLIQLFYKTRGNSITLIESRPILWNDPESVKIEMKIAQIHFKNENKTFTFYCADRNER